MKICVVGAGGWGKNHIRTLDELGILGGVVDSDENIRRVIRAKYPNIRVVSKVGDALEFDGYIIATPAESHHQIASFYLELGKHVLVEKPVSTNAEDAMDLRDLAEKNGVNLMAGHLLLFHPAIRKMKELIDGGEIGKIEYIYSNRLNLGTVRTEESVLWSFAPHDISLFQYFVGEFPTSVTSRGGKILRPDNYDTSLTILTYPNNIMGHIFVSWLHPFKEHRIVVVGSKGMLSYEDSSEEKNLLLYKNGIDWINGTPVKRDGSTETITYEDAQPLTEELKYFAERLDGSPVEVGDIDKAIDVVKILEMASNDILPTGHIEDTVTIDRTSVVGNGTNVWNYSRILPGSVVGKNCKIGQNVVIGPDVSIGNNCKIQNNVSVYKGVTFEDGVFCGPAVVFTNVKNPRATINRMDELQPTLVKKGATIGANATIVCGNTIGRHAFVGAGAVVTKDVPDYAVVVGNPAKQTGTVNERGIT